MTGRSKGYAFVQCVFRTVSKRQLIDPFCYRYKKSEDARMALEQMEGFELAGRTVSCSLFSACCVGFLPYRCYMQLQVNTVHEKAEQLNIRRPTLWMKQAVCESYLSFVTSN